MKRFASVALASALAVLLLGATPNDTAAQCANCDRCTGGHKAPSGSGEAYGSPHTDCIGGLWCTGHPPCGIGMTPLEVRRFEDAENLIEDARDGDFVAVLALLDEFPDHAYINQERAALQVRTLSNCEDLEGLLMGHIPLDEAQIALAAEARDVWTARQ